MEEEWSEDIGACITGAWIGGDVAGTGGMGLAREGGAWGSDNVIERAGGAADTSTGCTSGLGRTMGSIRAGV